MGFSHSNWQLSRNSQYVSYSLSVVDFDVELIHLSMFLAQYSRVQENFPFYMMSLFFVSPERSSERDYVITGSVCSMCM